MQLQIEPNKFPSKSSLCQLCGQSFAMKDAQVLVCNEQGKSHGQVCSSCIGRGFNWIQQQFELLQ
ncbi:MAG: hypothetical protein KME12_21605 [Trichocoleus desertorum ATA4-8-CV12]|nr:hypothetical protein [Trichocoleus desertorum ATA4-8-CV12]